MELRDELRSKITVLSDLSDADLDYIISIGEVLSYEANTRVFEQGAEADGLYIYLSGEVQIRRPDSGIAALYIAREGDVTGLLPYSRMTNFTGNGYTIFPTRALRILKDKFPDMLHRIPILGQRLISIMTDRVREVTKNDSQRDKLTALGKLSAGLAHELNNPAAAGKRAAAKLRETLGVLRDANRRIDSRELTTEQRLLISRIEEDGGKRTPVSTGIDALTRSDLEEQIATWLEGRGVKEGWSFAPALVDAELDVQRLEPLLDALGSDTLSDALSRISASITVHRLAEEIESATTRISELIRSIKEYSYMDQAPVQEVDLQAGIESTLTILAHKIRSKSITVERQFAEGLPHLQAYGRELNQVWTNLIDNALDAMPEGGHLIVHTAPERHGVCVEISDNGCGIPPEARVHIFEPFFTTKPVGEGTGLGLETVYRIVRKHHGTIGLDSKPGHTIFTVRLPLELNSSLEG